MDIRHIKVELHMDRIRPHSTPPSPGADRPLRNRIMYKISLNVYMKFFVHSFISQFKYSFFSFYIILNQTFFILDLFFVYIFLSKYKNLFTWLSSM